MSESVKVIARCRPLNESECKMKTETVVNMDPSKRQCSIKRPSESTNTRKVFTFDGVFDSTCGTDTIYQGIVQPIVQGVLEGYNGTVFAYGQTSCGKTFTMEGVKEPKTQTGIIPRCFNHILNSIHSNSNHDNREYLLHVSFLEIYNEDIRDLLVKNSRCKLEIKEHPDKGMYVKGLSSITVDCYEDMEEILAIGSANRSVGATCMNTDSSRSHSIFIIDLEMSVHHGEGKEFFRSGKLNLVDLAGSERQGKSLATGERFREATRINLSLSALGNVISALVDGKIKHIPYRDSKLTRLLQDSLGGNSRTLMIACISPGANNYEETLTTLRYAKRAKNIKNRPRINEDPKDSLIKKYQEEIQQLKRIIAKEIDIPPHLALEVEELRKKKVQQTTSTEQESLTTVTTTTTTYEVQEIQTEVLKKKLLHSEGLKTLSDLKTELSVEKRVELATCQTVVEENHSLVKSRRLGDGACALAIHSDEFGIPVDKDHVPMMSTSTDDLRSLESLSSDVSPSLSDSDVFEFPEDWDTQDLDGLMAREFGDGRSRSVSPYVGEQNRIDTNKQKKKIPVYLDEEGPVSGGLCNLCFGISFFGESVAIKQKVL